MHVWLVHPRHPTHAYTCVHVQVVRTTAWEHAEEGSVRLAGGAEAEGGGARFGRLEVFFRGGWGTVCGRDPDNDYSTSLPATFTPASAQVACRELGFSNAFALQPVGQVRLMHQT